MAKTHPSCPAALKQQIVELLHKLQRDQANGRLLEQIRAIPAMSDASYGVPRMAAPLARQGDARD